MADALEILRELLAASDNSTVRDDLVAAFDSLETEIRRVCARPASNNAYRAAAGIDRLPGGEYWQGRTSEERELFVHGRRQGKPQLSTAMSADPDVYLRFYEGGVGRFEHDEVKAKEAISGLKKIRFGGARMGKSWTARRFIERSGLVFWRRKP